MAHEVHLRANTSLNDKTYVMVYHHGLNWQTTFEKINSFVINGAKMV